MDKQYRAIEIDMGEGGGLACVTLVTAKIMYIYLALLAMSLSNGVIGVFTFFPKL